MKFSARKKAGAELPGITGNVRVDPDLAHLLPRVRPGDIVVVDLDDLDRATAQALLEAKAAAVINLRPMISGRYANRGPLTLAEAGVVVVEASSAGLRSVKDGTPARLDEGTLHVGGLSFEGVVLDGPTLTQQMDQARRGMLGQLATFTHHTTEFLQQEESLLLHDTGLPDLATTLQGRPVVVVGPGTAAAAELALIKRFVAEQRPVLVGIDAGADLIVQARLKPDVVVVGLRHEFPSPAATAAAKDVVVVVPAGTDGAALETFDRRSLRPLRVDSDATPEDVAMLLALAGNSSVIVAAGLDATLEEFLDSNRGGLASTFLTRLKVGPHLVDAQVVPVLYSGRVRPLHLLVLVLAGLVALAAAFTVTPLGEEWAHDAWAWLTDLFDSLQGKLS